MLLTLWLAGCATVEDTGETGDTADSGIPDACECRDPTTEPFAPALVGGFDDWLGNAVAWAVDPDAGVVLVVAMAYERGVATQELDIDCADPDALVGNWVAVVPPSAEADVASHPLLGAAITSAAGARSLGVPLGALLVRGDVGTATPTRIEVATDGGVSLVRGEGQDRVLGALSFAAVADEVGGDATVDCGAASRLAALDLVYASSGDE